MAVPWTCPNPACGLTWQTHDGSCPACFYGYTPQMLAQVGAMPTTVPDNPLLLGANGQAVRVQTPPAPPAPRPYDEVQAAPRVDPREAYTTLLKGVQTLLTPVVQWLTQHGIAVQNYTEAIPKLLEVVQAWEHDRHAAGQQPALTGAVESRLIRVETGLQQLALAVATLQHPPAPGPVPPVVPDTGYQSFMVTDRDQAQLEQALIQQGRQREWEGR